MPLKTLHLVSPNFSFEKLESGEFLDLVDVYEDRIKGWLIAPAKTLLTPNGSIAAVALAIGYFEGVEIYCSGEDSAGRSKEFFRRGFCRVFDVPASKRSFLHHLADAFYKEARCGFAHDGLFRNRVFFSNSRPEALNFTLPKKNGEFVPGGQVESIMVNPIRFVDAIEIHFSKYVEHLRSGEHPELQANFLSAVRLRWGLDEPERFVGMTEAEFHGEA